MGGAFASDDEGGYEVKRAGRSAPTSAGSAAVRLNSRSKQTRSAAPASTIPVHGQSHGVKSMVRIGVPLRGIDRDGAKVGDTSMGVYSKRNKMQGEDANMD